MKRPQWATAVGPWGPAVETVAAPSSRSRASASQWGRGRRAVGDNRCGEPTTDVVWGSRKGANSRPWRRRLREGTCGGYPCRNGATAGRSGREGGLPGRVTQTAWVQWGHGRQAVGAGGGDLGQVVHERAAMGSQPSPAVEYPLLPGEVASPVASQWGHGWRAVESAECKPKCHCELVNGRKGSRAVRERSLDSRCHRGARGLRDLWNASWLSILAFTQDSGVGRKRPRP
jgi:hypothetical protein